MLLFSLCWDLLGRRWDGFEGRTFFQCLKPDGISRGTLSAVFWDLLVLVNSQAVISCTRGHLCGPEWGGECAPRRLHFLLNSFVDRTGSTARMPSFWKVCSQCGPGLPKVTVPTHALRWPGIHWETMMGEVSRWLCPFPKESCGPIFLERVHFYTYMVCTIFTSRKTWRAAYYVFLNLLLLTFVA